ncbi:histidine phosphatase family protein [Pseudactinotalea sp.]|uniref:histidine phosphatase family protein n=1 Tax=Pseudactinotalea sp. TaxID=1926260 RepID=UPI003B3A5193
MRFVVIRHGQSVNNLLYEQTGDSVGRHHDPELTDLGHTQAARLAETVSAGALPWQITQIHTSLMTRAVQTAAPLADALDLPLLGHLDAYELGGPFTEADEVRTPHPGASDTALLAASARLVLPETAGADGWYTLPYEHDAEVRAARARALVSGLREQHDDGDVVALFTHGAFFQHLLRAFLGIEQMTGWVVKHNTAISLFADEPKTDGATVTAHALDWMPHLSDDLVSE